MGNCFKVGQQILWKWSLSNFRTKVEDSSSCLKECTTITKSAQNCSSWMSKPIFLLFSMSMWTRLHKNELFYQDLLISDAIFGTLGLYLPHCYLPDLATSAEQSPITNQEASVLISCINVGNMIGRIVIGAVVDLPWFDVFFVYNITAATTAVCMACFLAMNEFWGFAITSTIYGLSMSCYSSQASVVLAQVFGIKSLSSTFGLLSFFKGISTLISLPLAGFLSELIGTKSAIFLTGTFELTLAAILGFFAQYLLHKSCDWKKWNSGELHA